MNKESGLGRFFYWENIKVYESAFFHSHVVAA